MLFRLFFSMIVGYLLYICLTDRSAFFNTFLSASVFYPIAQLSYTAFLLQLIPLVYLTVSLSYLASDNLMFYFAVVYALAVPISLGLGAALSLLVERPIMRFQQRVYTPSIDEDFSPIFGYGSRS